MELEFVLPEKFDENKFQVKVGSSVLNTKFSYDKKALQLKFKEVQSGKLYGNKFNDNLQTNFSGSTADDFFKKLYGIIKTKLIDHLASRYKDEVCKPPTKRESDKLKEIVVEGIAPMWMITAEGKKYQGKVWFNEDEGIHDCVFTDTDGKKLNVDDLQKWKGLGTCDITLLIKSTFCKTKVKSVSALLKAKHLDPIYVVSSAVLIENLKNIEGSEKDVESESA